MNITWFLVIYLYSAAPSDTNYLDKVAVPMTGQLEQVCKKDAAGIWRYPGTLDGMDKLGTITVCVPFKQWRPS